MTREQFFALNVFPRRSRLIFILLLVRFARYVPFCADFGPFNLATTHHVCHILKVLLSNEEYRNTKIIYYTTQEASDVTNAVYLLGAFLCLQVIEPRNRGTIILTVCIGFSSDR